jgi:hypothetical protein
VTLLVGVSSANAQMVVCPGPAYSSGVVVHLGHLHSTAPGARTVTLCLKGYRCVRRDASPGELIWIRWHGPGHGAGPYEVSVVLRDRKHRMLLRARRRVTLEPVGPHDANCPPKGFVSELELNVRRRRLDLLKP